MDRETLLETILFYHVLICCKRNETVLWNNKIFNPFENSNQDYLENCDINILREQLNIYRLKYKNPDKNVVV